MVEFASLEHALAHKSIAVIAAIVAAGGALGGYAIHEHRATQSLAAKNAQVTAALNTTQHELSDLTAKVNMLAKRAEMKVASSTPAAQQSAQIGGGHPSLAHRLRDDPRYKKLQSQLDAQGKAIEQTRNDLAGAQGNLADARTELSGSIAHTHDELVLLEKKGERNFTEFDLNKSKQFRHEGPFELRLQKANIKHHYADLELMVDDRNMSQKHVNLYQPVMFSTPDTPQPVEVVINEIGKDRIHGYVSAPRYRQSELATTSNTPDNSTPNPAQGAADSTQQPVPREKLPAPQPK